MATALEGKGKEAVELFSMVNPINHALNKDGMQKYKTEPYVLCGDVYSNPQLRGHGGWSWYTGSASWMYKVGIEHIIGLKIKSDHFTIEPCVDPAWKEFSVTFHLRGVCYEVLVSNPDGVEEGVGAIEVDQVFVEDGRVRFVEDKNKTVRVNVVMG